MLEDRHSRVLEALVEEYIATGLPVSSQAILDRSGLTVSSATIRNDLARLEGYGFVAQPHTSAGRIPTPQGYRFYVDHASPTRLRSATRVRIEAFFADMHRELSRLLKETTGLLSDLSHYPAVVIGPGFAGESVRALHLVPLSEQVLLAVTVSGSGRVSQDVVRLAESPSDEDVAEAERYLATAFVAETITEGVTNIAALGAEAMNPAALAIVQAVAASMGRVDHTTKEVYVGGTSQLAELWQDLAHVHAVLGLLEQEAKVRHILDDESESTSVRLGVEIDVDDIDLAVVSSPYDAGDHGTGRVGVLGPMRMDYRRTIKIVEEVGEGLGDSIGR